MHAFPVTRITFIFIFLLLQPMMMNGQQVTIYKAKKIYLCDTAFTIAEAMAVTGDKIVSTGTFDSLKRKYENAKIINYGKQIIYPGLIDAHCHYYGTAKGMSEANLIGTKSELDAIKRLKKYAKSNKAAWIIGRGWDQNDWEGQQYPSIEALDKAFPNTPVFLKRIDGHAAWINTAAMKAVNLDPSKAILGGELILKDGKFSGILVDNAVDAVGKFVPELPIEERINALRKLEKKCFSYGLTTLDDAGLSVKEMEFLDSLEKQKLLKMRLYVMLSSEDNTYKWISENGIYKSPQMHVSAVKFYLDGALGSRGALLKKDYCDLPGHRGLMVTPADEISNKCYYLFTAGYQACIHAIGDSANKIALSMFRSILPVGMDMRWRIEHAQITDTKDLPMYSDRSIIPSVQPTHATSDAPWAKTRLCENRMKGAYAYETLRKKCGMVVLGTDFPVEDISPFKTFYSAVTRLDAGGILQSPFIPEEALSRKDAILGMTIWPAFANLEEYEKGSLETGKLADFVVLNQDLMTVPVNKIMKTKAVATYIGNILVYKK